MTIRTRADADAVKPQRTLDDSPAGVYARQIADATPGLRRYAHKLTRASAIDRDDLVQDTLVLAITKRHLFEIGNFQAWLNTLCRNRFIDLNRRAGRTEPLPRTATGVEIDIAPPTPASQVDSVVLREVAAALRQLSREQQLVLIGVVGRSQSYEALAEQLGIAVGTVRSRLFRARRALEAAVEGHTRPAWLASIVIMRKDAA